MKYKIETPRVPNFIRVTIDGDQETKVFPLTAFEDAELNSIADSWRTDLFKNRNRQAINPDHMPKEEDKGA